MRPVFCQKINQMCGILGLVGAPHPGFSSALKRIAHRGPDGEGQWHGEGVSIGHRRLSILDLSTAADQPMHWGPYVVVYNGEIFNFLEIRSRLQALGHQFETDSDTEVLIKAYEQWGPACLQQFNGMWAFAIWHKTERTLFCARDRFGIKPFYFFQEGGRFAFASEQKALLPLQAHPGVSPHFERLSHFRLSYESTTETLVTGIARLPAGHYGILSANGSWHTTRYWHTLSQLEDVPTDYATQCSQWRALFLEACRIRSRSDVPVATALSGGLDSSAIFCTQHHLRVQAQGLERQPSELHAFSAIFPGTELDETAYAEAVLAHTGRPGTFIEPVFSDDFERVLDGYYYMEDLWPSSPVPMIALYQAMRDKGFVVSLDGHGGDELLAGYGTGYRALAEVWPHVGSMLEVLDAFPEHDDATVAQKLAYALRYLHAHKKTIGRAKLLRLIGGLGLPDWALARLHLPARSTTPEYLMDALQALNYQLFHTSVLPSLLRNYDRFSMAAGVESRAPFLDHHLVSYTFSLGWQALMRDGYNKAILRGALQGILTPAVATRKSKIGFNANNHALLRDQWRQPLKALLAENPDGVALTGQTVEHLFATYDMLVAQPATLSNKQALELWWQRVLPVVWHKSFYQRACSQT